MATAPELSESERSLLALVKEGRVDAEIAVRLGLATGEVRGRIERLAAKLNVDGKAGLRSWDGPVERSEANKATRRLSRTVLPAAAIAVVALVAGIWIGRASDTGLPAVGPAATVTSVAGATSEALSATATPAPTIRNIGGVAYVDLGPFIQVSGHPFDVTVHVDQRPGLTVVALSSAGLVQFQGPFLRRIVNGAAYGEGSVDGKAIAVYAFPADNDTALETVNGAELAYSRGPNPPLLTIRAAETRGFAQDTRGLRPYYATVDNIGHLLVSLQPVPSGQVIDQTTGVALDVSGATLMGVVASKMLTTSCLPRGLCGVSVEGDAFPAPSNGAVQCTPSGTLEFSNHGTGVRLTFQGFNGSVVPKCPVVPKELIANDEIVGGYFIARATDFAGNPLSLAVAGDGSLYVGTFVASVGCPCMPRD